jgi:hypothetical protein
MSQRGRQSRVTESSNELFTALLSVCLCVCICVCVCVCVSLIYLFLQQPLLTSLYDYLRPLYLVTPISLFTLVPLTGIVAFI